MNPLLKDICQSPMLWLLAIVPMSRQDRIVAPR